MDLDRIGKQFQVKLREMYRMEEGAFLREVEWLHQQPPLPRELERSLLRLLRKIVLPSEYPVSKWLDGIPSVQANCFKGFVWRRLLGRGEYGKVYLVQQGAQFFALKEIDLQSLGPRYVPKLQNEIQLARKAGLAGIGPRIHDAYLCEDRLYIRMEYLEGVTLDEYIERNILGARDRQKITEIVDRLHQIGIAHQDLHAGNILVQTAANGRPVFRIIDYGFAETKDTMLNTEKKQVQLMLQEISEMRDESLVRQWALYRLLADGVIKVPVKTRTVSRTSSDNKRRSKSTPPKPSGQRRTKSDATAKTS